jgi:hypothetical protein
MDTHPVRAVRENIMHQAVRGASPRLKNNVVKKSNINGGVYENNNAGKSL